MGMKIISTMRRQTAVYWGNPTSDGRGGSQMDLPVEIACRWDASSDKVMLPSGEEIIARSTVYTDQDVVEGGFLYLGTLASLDGEKDPALVTGAYEIRKFDKNPVLKVRTDGLDPNADEYLRTAWL